VTKDCGSHRANEHEKAGFFSSHATTNSRIRAAEKLDLPGVFQSSHPASVLFRKFDEESRQLTRFLYSLQFRQEVDEDRLRPTDEALKVYVTTMS
jgi:hypothetical protein